MSKPYHDKKTLRDDLQELKTQTAVAEKYGVSQATIGWFVRKFDLEQKGWSYDSWTDEDTPWRNENTLRRVCEESDSVTEVSNRLDCTRKTVNRWMERHEINIQFWKGDGYTSPYPGDWRNIAEKIRDRDGMCVRCGIEPERTLSVHHIVPVKEFEDPKEAHYPENLLSLCRSCHRKVEPLPEEKQREIIQ
jgi:5-methylcytosine-specific restriction endonuclease McrA